jgi:hypothetical protein
MANLTKIELLKYGENQLVIEELMNVAWKGVKGKWKKVLF